MPSGYAQAYCPRLDRKRAAHQVAWEQAAGQPIPPGHIVCHVCDVRNCVNTDGSGVYTVDGVDYPRYGHLWLGTHKANARDRVLKGRVGPGLTPVKEAARRDKARLARSIERWLEC